MLSLQLKYFENAAKTENFSHTAHLFGVPTSAVSSSIKKLESQVGVPLFYRTANKIKLNEYGRILLKAVETSLEAFKKAKAEISERGVTPTGEIRLLILANRKKVTDVISSFKRMYPEISFIIKHTFPENTSELKNYDIIVGGKGILSDCFEKRFWLREDVFLAVHKDNPLSNRKCISAEELRDQKFISLHKGSSIRNYMDAFFSEKEIKVDTSIECDDPKYLIGYLEMNLGVVLLPYMAMGSLISDSIKLLKIDEGLHRDTYIYTNKNHSGIAKELSLMFSQG